MADLKVRISQLPPGTPLETDVIPYVDGATNTTKKALKSELKGDSGTVTIGTTTTLNPGENATVTNTGTPENSILNFGIPKGDIGPAGPTGPTGSQGRGIVSTTLISTVGKVKTYRQTYTDTTTYDYTVTDGTDGVGAGDRAFIGTGVLTPVNITQGTGNTFNVTGGNGCIYYNNVYTTVSWADKLNVSDDYLTIDVTYLFIDSIGNLVQQTTVIPQDLKNKIFVGAIGKTNSVITFFKPIFFDVSTGNTLLDFIRAVGPLQDGNIKLLGRTDLGVNITAGTIFSIGSNPTNTTYGPNYTPIGSIGLKPFQMVQQNGAGGFTILPETTLLTPGVYDLNGTLTSLGATKFQNMYAFISTTGKLYIQYGQFIYDNLSDAKDGIATELFNKWKYVGEIVSLAVITIKGNATATNSATACLITNLGKFGNGGGSGGGGTIADHNSLTGIQGGATGDYQHLTTAQVTNLNNQSGTNTGDNAPNSLYSGLATSKQDTLVNQTNIKSINGESLLGSGDIVISGGGGGNIDLADYQGQAYTGRLGSYTFTSAKTLTKCSLSVEGIPVGSNCILELRKNGTNILSAVLQVTTSDTLTNGFKLVSVTSFSNSSISAGETVVAFLTSVGSTTPALNPVCYLDFN